MEFREGLVANETQYFADRFDPGPSRAHLVERVGEMVILNTPPRRTRIGVDVDEISLGLVPPVFDDCSWAHNGYGEAGSVGPL